MTTLPPAAAQALLDDVDSRESDSLLLAANGDPWLSESLARRARAGAGAVVRLANGVYCDTESWLRCPPWDRYLLAVVAHARSRRREVVFCHITAAILHGLPSRSTPTLIHTRATSRGGAGTAAPVQPYVHPAAALETAAALRRQGVRLPRGRLPLVPAIRSRWKPPAPPKGRPAPVEVLPVQLSDGRCVGHVLADSRVWSSVALFTTEPLVESIAAADQLLRRFPDDFTAVAEALRDLDLPRTALSRAGHTMAFADSGSESPKESISRALIHELGFVVPGLQYHVLDDDGHEVARTDFWWKRSSVRPRTLLGEFDGLWKYGVDLAGPGGGAAALEREKRRELQLARLGYDVVRWIDADLRNPRDFGRILASHGVPLRT